MNKLFLFFFFWGVSLFSSPCVRLGVDVFFEEGRMDLLKKKKVALITNHTGLDSSLHTTLELLQSHAKEYQVAALFCPEHGIRGSQLAGEEMDHESISGGIPVYSLYGSTRRPTEKMLQGIDLIIFDIQEIGCRSYTYATTLFYVMEESAKQGIEVVIFDRPNPLSGSWVDGPMLQEQWRSFLGYVNVPYCHGMTIGELAGYFNDQYEVKCRLTVVPMKGWKRGMTYEDTGLFWIPTSPHIPEADTPLYYASTGILGELDLVSIGIGYTLPFKVVGAPWIEKEKFADLLNRQNLPGVKFLPFSFRPFYGVYKNVDCDGVHILITDKKIYRPLSVQYALLGLLKSLYPKEIQKYFHDLGAEKKRQFCQVNGNAEILQMIEKEKYVVWKMIHFDQKERENFLEKRKRYLLYGE
jgi:uncharacterized protein YbbC (DUF1343 family)